MSSWPRSHMWVVLAASMLLEACVGAPRHYAMNPLPVLNSCQSNPAACASGMATSEVARARLQTAATAGYSLVQALRTLEGLEKASVEQVLKECADEARSEVLVRDFGGRSPTARECNEEVGRDARGGKVTRAMRLGEAMHQWARVCVQERLGPLRPGRFSLEQRYRYDSETRRTSLVSQAEVDALLRQGRAHELVGTLQPDVVIHSGDPLRAEAVYDFKFPCVNTDKIPDWRKYESGHPHQGFSQKNMYEMALGAQAWRVLPRLGVVP